MYFEVSLHSFRRYRIHGDFVERGFILCEELFVNGVGNFRRPIILSLFGRGDTWNLHCKMNGLNPGVIWRGTV